jgi:hypothetical protein
VFSLHARRVVSWFALRPLRLLAPIALVCKPLRVFVKKR